MFLENVWPGKVAIAVIIALVQLLPRGEPTRDDYVRRTYDYVGFFGPNFAPGKTAPELVSKWSSTAIFPSEEKTLFLVRLSCENLSFDSGRASVHSRLWRFETSSSKIRFEAVGHQPFRCFLTG